MSAKHSKKPSKIVVDFIDDDSADDTSAESDVDSDASESKVTTKKGPGRPRKVPKKEPMPRNGIMQQPSDLKHVVEFVYDTPILIKKVITFFKSLAVAQIQCIFRPTEIILYARDHHNKSKIRVRIDGNKINHYYVKKVVDIGLTHKDLEQILNKVDKEYSSILLLSSEESVQKNLTLLLDNDIQIDEEHSVDLIGLYPRIENEHEFTDENYMVQFEWPGKYFRKTINDIKSISNTMSIIQKNAESPMIIEYISANKKIRSTHLVKNAERIKFKSKLHGSESFRVDLRVDHIKPISSAHIADEITILVDENKKLMTKTLIDNGTIEIKTLTEIIDERPKDE